MSQELVVQDSKVTGSLVSSNSSLALGAGLAVASMILLPAVAMRLGLGASLTGALRIALMKASSKATRASRAHISSTAIGTNCN